MGLIKPTLPDVPAAEFAKLSRAERIQIVTRHWVENGFGSPDGVFAFYLIKCALWALGAALVIAATPGIGGLGDIDTWWDAPIVYQKLIVWTLLWEVLGLGCGSGPLTSRFNPPIGGVIWWLRPGTIRLPAWPGKVPFTAGDRRTLVDVGLYAGVLASSIYLLTRPGDGTSISGFGSVGLIDPAATIPLIATLGILGLRDKTIFLAARGEQYALSVVLFFFPYNDMFIGFKLVMLALWWGAATSKVNRHFPYVVATMMSNAPLVRSRRIKRAMYRNYPEDLRPSAVPTLLAHVGTATEYLVPLFLVFLGDGGTLTWIALAYMAFFHLHIFSTVPMGVPLEWNLFFIFSLFYLFGAHGDLTVWDMEDPLLLLAVLLPSLLVIPILGNLRPDLISFLPAMRYYAGNWATSVWVFAEGSEQKLEDHLVTASKLPQHQLESLYDTDTAFVMSHKVPGWRAMHTHGRAHNGLVDRVMDGKPGFITMDGELVAGMAIGWNFGEGHLHNDQLMRAIQSRCHFKPGELRVITLEGQPFGRPTQDYKIFDAALGLLETGYVKVDDMLARQPWPTDGVNYPIYGVTNHLTPVARESMS